jgi:hypothetical protein
MSEPSIPLKNPWLAAVLAFLIPGAGHLYQGRTFKGALYCVCILGTFLYGMHLAEWRAVYAYAGEPGGPRQRVYGYFAQFGVGAPAVFALAQGYRYQNDGNQPVRSLDEPLSAPFRGTVKDGDRALAEVTGEIRLEPVMGRFGPDVGGVFEGTIHGDAADPRPVRFQLQGPLELDRPLSADPRRGLEIGIAERVEGPERIEAGQYLSGSVPRSFWNWFEIPPEQSQIERLHRDRGRFFDLGMVYTWIAGLLNVLVIWDALEGPAYGYGDEDEEDSESGKKDKPQERPSATAAGAESTADSVPQSQSAAQPVRR